jgi:hypothetical protein
MAAARQGNELLGREGCKTDGSESFGRIHVWRTPVARRGLVARPVPAREAVSLLLALPIALPGIITGIALRATIGLADIPSSVWTMAVGDATFCTVV